MDSLNDDELLEKIRYLDQKAIEYQNTNKFIEALDAMEQNLLYVQQYYGNESDHFWNHCKNLGELCNLLSMTFLQQMDYLMVQELLKKAEILTERDPQGRAVTYNNLACYYRKQGKLHAALKYLEKAEVIEKKISNCINPADTHLNICAVLSQLGRHKEALDHAKIALILIQDTIFKYKGDDDPPPDRVIAFAITYHNIGVEEEFLKKYDKSLNAYKKSTEICEKYLGVDHHLTLSIKQSYQNALKVINKKLAKESQMKTSYSSSAFRNKRTFKAVGIPTHDSLIKASQKPPTHKQTNYNYNDYMSPRPDDRSYNDYRYNDESSNYITKNDTKYKDNNEGYNS